MNDIDTDDSFEQACVVGLVGIVILYFSVMGLMAYGAQWLVGG